jgi:hypothetical protein
MGGPRMNLQEALDVMGSLPDKGYGTSRMSSFSA